MTAVTATSRAQFHTLKIQLIESLAEVAERLDDARQAGNQPLVEELLKGRSKIVGRAIEVRRAEIAYLNSPLSVDNAVQRLFSAVKAANTGLRELEDLSTALSGVARIVRLLGRLVGLFA